MHLHIRAATEADIPAVTRLYGELCDYLADKPFSPGWEKGLYPAEREARDGLLDGGLFVAVAEEGVVGSLILRHKPEPAYLTAPWQAALDEGRVLVIYTFAVSPSALRQGVGAQLLQFAERYARDSGIEALRLDVFEKNLPAIQLYEKCGFSYIDTVSLGLEAYGLDWFRLYEKLL